MTRNLYDQPFWKNARNIIVKKESESTEVLQSFGEHYLSNFVAEPELDQLAENSTDDTSTETPNLSEKSKEKYTKAFNVYLHWCQSNNISPHTSEQALLRYFQTLSEKQKPTTLWTTFSMLRATISMQDKIDISKYETLLGLLKKSNENYLPKTTTQFTREDVANFLTRACDEEFLLYKVILIIGIAGGLKRQELCSLPFENVTDLGDLFQVKIDPDLKGKKSRIFYITPGSIPGINLVEILRKYVNLRPLRVEHNRFFLQFRKKYCTKQPVGTGTFCTVPKIVAHYLGLPNPQNYTGHCFVKSTNALDFSQKGHMDRSNLEICDPLDITQEN